MKVSPEVDRHHSLEGWLKRVKSLLIIILSIAAWAGSLYLGFIGTPPPGDAGKPEDLTFVARIVIGSFFVLWGSLASVLSRRDHIWFWRALLFLALILTLSGWGGYRWIGSRWICKIDSDLSYVRGNTYTDLANGYLKEQRDSGRMDEIGCQELIDWSHYKPNRIWPQTEIYQNRGILIAMFLSVIPLFVLTLSSAAQIVVCHSRPAISSYFSGEWRDDWAPEKIPKIQLELSVIDKKVVGTIKLNFLTGNWQEKQLVPENAYFRFNTLHFDLERPFCRLLMRVDADGQTAHLTSGEGVIRSWTLTKGEQVTKRS